MRVSAPSSLLVAAALAVHAGCGAPQPPQPPAPSEPTPSFGEAWLALQLDEEVLALLQAHLHPLRRGMGNLALPDLASREAFASSVEVVDLTALGPFGPSSLPARFHVEEAPVTLGAPRAVARDEIALLAPLFARMDRLIDAGLSAKRGRFLDAGKRRFEVTVGITALGVEPDGALLDASGLATAEAVQASPAEPGVRARWEFTAFRIDALTVRRRAEGPVFAEVLRERMQPELAARAARSLHEEYVDAAMADPVHFVPPSRWWDPVSHDRHPALSVVDVDGDGRDELYVMARWGPNMLLAQGPDGLLIDRAPELGLDLADHSSAALFADLDNDGDVDLLLGRTLERSVLLLQEDGRFVDRSAAAGVPLPRLVSGLSAADVDGDGRLDLFAATYGRKVGPEFAPELWPADETERSLLVGRSPILDAGGPSNVLLRNLGGGRFADVSREAGVADQRQTFQGSFGDVDGDGDPDLYLANDFAPNRLLVNRGDGTFAPSPDEGAIDQGFGMGASFGDIDGDGDPDLYVSNMYSKAGERVLRALPDVDPRYASMARGNSLLRNDGGHFTRISGRTPDTAQVEASGWSWSGLLRDLDADGRLDVAVLNGYFTPPRRHALPVDI